MLRVGLTGGIGSGKTTVAAMFRELGCPVVEADPLAHALSEPGRPAYREIVREFGPEILRPDGRIDRPKLAGIVFADPARLARLNQILHPRIVEEAERRAAEIATSQSPPFIVVEAPLLIEAGYHRRFDRLIVVWCRPEQQRERMLARGMAPEEIDRRLAAQMPLEEKRRVADEVIDASGTLADTRRQVELLVEKLERVVREKSKEVCPPKPAEGGRASHE
jgi:dephospho-CoA kinase